MRVPPAVLRMLAMLLALGVPCRADTPAREAIVPCSIDSGDCQGSSKDLRRAALIYARGYKLRDKDHAAAYQDFMEAARLVPGNVDYLTARELARTALVNDRLERGNRLLAGGRQVEAAAEFRAALELDSSNAFAQQRLFDAAGGDAPRLSPGLRLVAKSDPVDLQPRSGRETFHYRGDSRGLYDTIARSFGLRAVFDDSFQTRPVRFEVENIDFAQAIDLARLTTKSMWVPLSERDFFVAADTAENHRQYDRMSLRSFYSLGATTQQELNDVVSLLRGVFDIRLVNAEPGKNMITVRAPRETLEAATEFLKDFSQGPPQVMLDVQVFEVDYTALRNLGIQLPLQYSMFNLSQAAALLGSQTNIQQLINQLIASGGINQANSTALSALLAQLQQQQLSSLLTTPFATFGGGITLFGVTLPKSTANFSFNSSNVRNLQHMTLRAMQGKPATMRIGTRYPILNATFAPIFNSAAIAQSIQSNTFQAAFPSVSYEDLGLSVKATPSIHGISDVSLELETELKALTGQVFNSVPVISNRSYKGTITVKEGEMAVVVGNVNRSEQISLSGLPGAGLIPELGLLTANQSKSSEDDELMFVITPHILNAPREEPAALWLPAGK